VSRLNVVDSSAWLEYFGGTVRAKLFAKPIESPDTLIVPVISLYEVFKKVNRDFGEEQALAAASVMQSGQVISLEPDLAIDAGRLRLPLAASLSYSTARQYDATLWTQDEHFKGLAGVKYFLKKG
jgi:predicted nucleic acid-binding protein